MVGDGLSDYQAAQETGVRFLARESGSVFAELDVERVRDLVQMAQWLAEAGS
jgi:phosphoglycolate phosphatase-like HAD superfamily hydrolase